MLQTGQRFSFLKSRLMAWDRAYGSFKVVEYYNPKYVEELPESHKLEISEEDVFIVESAYASIGGWWVGCRRESDGQPFEFLQYREIQYAGEIPFDPNKPVFIKDEEILLR
jgi:hypothetical protein